MFISLAAQCGYSAEKKSSLHDEPGKYLKRPVAHPSRGGEAAALGGRMGKPAERGQACAGHARVPLVRVGKQDSGGLLGVKETEPHGLPWRIKQLRRPHCLPGVSVV